MPWTLGIIAESTHDDILYESSCWMPACISISVKLYDAASVFKSLHVWIWPLSSVGDNCQAFTEHFGSMYWDVSRWRNTFICLHEHFMHTKSIIHVFLWGKNCTHTQRPFMTMEQLTVPRNGNVKDPVIIFLFSLTIVTVNEWIWVLKIEIP